jgi:hypothetical protein
VALVVGGTLTLLAVGDRWPFADRSAGTVSSPADGAPGGGAAAGDPADPSGGSSTEPTESSAESSAEPSAGTAAGNTAGSSAGDSAGSPAGDSAGSSAGDPDGTGAPGSPALAPLPAGADTADEQLGATTTAVAGALGEDPGALGPAGGEVLAGLRQVEAADGPARRLAAVGLSDSVTAAVDDGRLDAQAGRQVLGTLAIVARPERLIDLVQMVEIDPAAIGPAGPALHGDLYDLDHVVPGEGIADSAAELAAAVEAAAADGRVSEAFRAVAVPELQRLADPTAYQDLQHLLADVERDPAAIGPAGHQVLESLRTAAGQPVYPQGNIALDLLAVVRQDGQVTHAFREEAVPVLEALVR